MPKQVKPEAPELPPGYLDLSKRMTNKRLGLPDSEIVRLIVWEIYLEDSWERKEGEWITVKQPIRTVFDIIEGSRTNIVRWFNREREWWAERKCEVKVENVSDYNGGH